MLNPKEFPIKRYMLFAYDEFYQRGGLNDCVGWSMDVDELHRWSTLKLTVGNYRPAAEYDTCFILDTQTGEETNLKPVGDEQ